MINTDPGMNMPPCHPGEFIRIEVIDEMGLSVTQMAEVLEVPPAAVSDLVNCKTRLTPEMALRIEQSFGIGMDLLLKIQGWYDAVQTRAEADESPVERYQPG